MFSSEKTQCDADLLGKELGEAPKHGGQNAGHVACRQDGPPSRSQEKVPEHQFAACSRALPRGGLLEPFFCHIRETRCCILGTAFKVFANYDRLRFDE